MARINRTCSGETPIKIISNSKRASKLAEDEHQINQNQGRGKLCQYRRRLGQRNQTNCIYDAKINAGQIYMDQTGLFPVVCSKVNKYIMVLYEYDDNAILAEPIKNRTSAELLRAFQVMEKKLTARGFQQKLMRLDNEASQLLKSYLNENNITFQLVSPYSHLRNAAERAIRSFKDHLFNCWTLLNGQSISNVFVGQTVASGSNHMTHASNILDKSQAISLHTH
jgi:hypothetical protein